MAQWYAQVGGQRYGPVDEQEMRSWVQQGRVKPTDYVWSEGMANWLPVDSAFPGVAPTAAAGGQPPYVAAPVQQYAQPHRGTTILALGILSLMVCWLLGVIAWVMANNDLREMAAGRMDRSGEGNTRAGKTCGMIGTILGIVGIGIGIIWVVVFVSMAPHGHGFP